MRDESVQVDHSDLWFLGKRCSSFVDGSKFTLRMTGLIIGAEEMFLCTSPDMCLKEIMSQRFHFLSPYYLFGFVLFFVTVLYGQKICAAPLTSHPYLVCPLTLITMLDAHSCVVCP